MLVLAAATAVAYALQEPGGVGPPYRPQYCLLRSAYVPSCNFLGAFPEGAEARAEGAEAGATAATAAKSKAYVMPLSTC